MLFIGLFCVSQAGMDTLQEWDFEKYSQSAAKKALNHNIKHVMKEGGRAGKALMINTDKLISTVQILGTAGGAAKAVQAITVTTGVMSALFLALDVFFLAKDSHELRKGAKTKFANKIRDVCKELQDGLLELNKVKTQLQKTMDGIEVEEYEEIEEVEVEVDDDLASDPKKLAELELELDLMEEKLDKKTDEDEKKSKVMEKDHEKSQKGTKKGENKDKMETGGNTETLKTKDDKEKEVDSKLEIGESEQKNETVNSAKVKVVKDSSQKERKADKETVNYVIASKEKTGSMKDTDKKEGGLKNKTDMKEREKDKSGKEHVKRAQSGTKQEEQHGRSHSKRGSERSKDAEREVHAKKEVEGGNMRSNHENRETDKESGSNEQNKKMEEWRMTEERSVTQRRAEMSMKSEETSRGSRREGDVRKKSHRSRATQERCEQEATGSREECKRRLPRTAAAHQEPMDARVEKSGDASSRKKSESMRDKERRRSRDGDKEGRASHRGSRGRSSVLREDGLYI